MNDLLVIALGVAGFIAIAAILGGTMFIIFFFYCRCGECKRAWAFKKTARSAGGRQQVTCKYCGHSKWVDVSGGQ